MRVFVSLTFGTSTHASTKRKSGESHTMEIMLAVGSLQRIRTEVSQGAEGYCRQEVGVDF